MEKAKNRALVIALPYREYERLAEAATQACRDPEDQAHWYVRRALNRQTTTPKIKEASLT